MENKLLDLIESKQNYSQSRDTSKTYHKITISVNQHQKEAINRYAKSKNLKVSALIKSILIEKDIIE
jgi:hypothetical protein